jgi:hypothetical protein
MNWNDEGKKIGKYAESLEHDTLKRGLVDDQIHSIGDDMGDLITKAYCTDGVDAAVGALVGYFDEYNKNRAAHGTPPLTPANATAHLPWAFKPEALKKNEIEEVRKGFRRLRP